MILYRSVLQTGGKDYSASYTATVNGVLQKSSCAYALGGNTTFNSPVTIGNNVKSCQYMFSGCYNFNQNITIPNSVTNTVSMFMFCNNFNQNIVIPNSVTNTYRMFNGCTNFNQNIVIPNSVTDTGFMFASCVNFNQNIKISENAKDCSDMFYYCKLLNQKISIPEGVISCRFMFEGCRALNQEIQVPANAVDTTDMFRYCYNLNQSFSVNSELAVGMFVYCNSLNRPIILGNVKNAYALLSYASNFNQDITIPNMTENICSLLAHSASFAKNIYIKGNLISRNGSLDTLGLLQNSNNSLRKNIWFNSTLNAYFNKTGINNSIVGLEHNYSSATAITWTSMTNGFYNTAYNIYCYNNYTG